MRRRRASWPRAFATAAKQEAGEVVGSSVVLRIGQVVWWIGTYPFRVLSRGADVL